MAQEGLNKFKKNILATFLKGNKKVMKVLLID